MSVGQRIAKGMTGFASGIMREIDPQSLAKGANKAIKNGATKESAIKGAQTLAASGSHKFGRSVASAKPMMGMTATASNLMNRKTTGMTAMKAIQDGHKVNKKYSPGRIAGTAATIGVAGRVATGGGLYRDRYGNFNLPGVPFL